MSNDEFGRLDAQVTQAFDQQLSEVKIMYQGFDAEERSQFKVFVTKAAESATIADRLPANISLRVVVSETAFDDQGECLYSGHASLTPRVILRAIEAWERGDEFTPKSFGTI